MRLLICFILFTGILNAQPYQAKLLGTWSDDGLVPSAAHNNTYNEVWGYAVNGHEFAIIGSTFGTHFIDVTDPENPVEVHRLEGGSSGPQIIHRDYHDYQGYLYAIADEGSNTSLQIIDMTKLPDEIEVVYDSQEFFTRSHNIFIDSSRARLYSLVSNGAVFGYSPMRIFDISNPIDPQPLKAYNNLGGKSISQVHDAFVKNDTAYLNLGPGGFAIVDFENVDTPNVISILNPIDYPESGYNHSGWLTEDGQYYYMADENWRSDIKVIDVREMPDIEVVNMFNIDGKDDVIAHNQIVYDNKLYVSYYFDGVQVYDLTNPVQPQRLWYYDTSSEVGAPNLYRGCWGVYPFLPSGNLLASDMQNGLFVINGNQPTSVYELGGQTFKIFPNPGYDFIHIETEQLEFPADVLITDIHGQKVLEYTLKTAKSPINIEMLKPGAYILNLINKNSLRTEQFIKY